MLLSVGWLLVVFFEGQDRQLLSFYHPPSASRHRITVFASVNFVVLFLVRDAGIDKLYIQCLYLEFRVLFVAVGLVDSDTQFV